MRKTTMFGVFSILFGASACTIDARCTDTSDVACRVDDDDDDDTGDDDDDTAPRAEDVCDGEGEYLVQCTAPEDATRVRACSNFMAGTDTADQHWNCTEWQDGNVFTWCGTVLVARLARAAACPDNQCGLEFSVEVNDESHWLCTDAPAEKMDAACNVDGPTPVLVHDVDNEDNGCHGHLTNANP